MCIWIMSNECNSMKLWAVYISRLFTQTWLVLCSSTNWALWQSINQHTTYIDAPIKLSTFIQKLVSLSTDYSKRSIPIPTKEEYKIQLKSKFQNVLKRMHWKALQFHWKLESSNKDKYRFKSQKYSQTIYEKIDFEDDSLSLIKNIEFCDVINTLQEQLVNSIKEINCTNRIIVPA